MSAELASEAPTGYLSGLIKSRKEKTERSKKYWEVEEGKRLLEGNRAALTKPWSEEEVKTVLRELPAGKAPGQDGLPKELFEQNWELLGKELMKLIGDFEKDAVMPEAFTTAVTILLHKKGEREQLGNYRLITLLSVVYKLIAKVLANRIKKVLPRVISEHQFGFIPGRRLADVVSIVADVVDAAAEGDEDWLLLLVDLKKAYDSVSREFLFTTMHKMGFCQNPSH
ncbi:unnamed protein product [Closterium sp. Yama58-4]|nr:unnamed protein product [Closterium sp. Yama58-4]